MSAPPSQLRIGVPRAYFPARVDAVIEQALSDQRLVGAVVLVAQDDELSHRRAAGSTNREVDRTMSGRFVADLRNVVYGAGPVEFCA